MAPPILLAQPEAMVDVAEGSNVTFSVIAAGYLLNYTWQRSNETQLTEGARYVGVAISTLTILSVQFGDVGGYVCTVTNTAGSVQSEEAQLTICKYTSSVRGFKGFKGRTWGPGLWVSRFTISCGPGLIS